LAGLPPYAPTFPEDPRHHGGGCEVHTYSGQASPHECAHMLLSGLHPGVGLSVGDCLLLDTGDRIVTSCLLGGVVSNAPVTSVQEAIARMEAIGAAVPAGDGTA
jgi:hypothetical protein